MKGCFFSYAVEGNPQFLLNIIFPEISIVTFGC